MWYSSKKEDKLLVAAELITDDISKEIAASELLAETTQASAELLAETTQASADLLAATTARSAEELSRSNAISVKWVKWMTFALIGVGLIQIALAIIPLFRSTLAK